MNISIICDGHHFAKTMELINGIRFLAKM